jgi:hypothetical protein
VPARLNAKGPGEFIRDHLQEPSTGGRDYVGSMYQAYKEHLRSAGARRLPCRITFHKYVWLLKETGALIFDGAEAISFSDEPPQDLPPDYEPSCGTPAPRHYYRLVDPQNPAFLKPETIWRQHRGLPALVAAPRPAARVPAVVQPLAPAPPRIAPPPAVEAPPALRPRRRRTVAERLEEKARAFRSRIEALREQPDPEELARLEQDMLGFFDQVLDAAERSRGENRRRLLAVAERFERAAEGFGRASSALAEGRTEDYLAALDLLAGCCPP